ncbi:MAG: hypothetical protein CBD77_00200 [bacterium TMED217]|nr:MAG: hypothetical protein CBD77_00200 [bacterium TMED217]|tara:strand:+ start:6566 stop:9118 length:2553 start_codon:yes stop_codon:yes gene_type:complete
MIIKKPNSLKLKLSRNTTYRKFNKIFLNKYINILFFLFFIFFTSTYFFWLGAYGRIDGTLGRYRVFLNGLYQENINIVKNFVNGKLSNPASFSFDVKFQNLKEIQNKIDLLRKNEKILDKEERKLVNASLTYKGEKYDVGIRLAGGEMDHVSSTKWSFRCKVKNGKSIMGMHEFNLMNPHTRLLMSPWVCNEFYKKNDFININYEFVDITINGELKGVYILEEWFDKPMIEKDGGRAGIIFSPRYNDVIKIFKENKVLKNDQLKSQLSYLKNNYFGLINGEVNPSFFFDYDKFAKHFALVDLLNGSHVYNRQNTIWYFNPITKLVEPIGREWSSRAFNKIESITIDLEDVYFNKILFSDENFTKLYFKELELVSSKSYLESFFTEIKAEKDSLSSILHKDYPYYNYSFDYLIRNQKYIRNRLNKITDKIDTKLIIKEHNRAFIQIINNTNLPIQLNEIILNNENISIENKLLQDSSNMVLLDLDDYSNFSSAKKLETIFLNIEVLFLNQKKTFSKKVLIPIEYRNSLFTFLSKPNQEKIFKKYDLKINHQKQLIEFPQEVSFDEVIIIPPNYNLICNAGTKIKFEDGGGLVSYSSIYLNGSRDSPIIIEGNSSQSNSLVVIGNGVDTSKINYTNFYNLSKINEKDWGITGSITFYKAPVIFDNCSFSNNVIADDFLNIIKSNFKINNCVFNNSFADALDADFCTGVLNNMEFNNIGNDALDFSGSNIYVDSINFKKVGDKAISAGEGTIINGSSLIASSCEIAITSKDDSFIFIEDVNIFNTKVAFCAFNKKSIYGPGVIEIRNSKLSKIDVPFLIEKGSRLTIDDSIVDPVNNKKVKDMLYGIEYGKKS